MTDPSQFLAVLEKNREALLRAELAALFHDLGKLSIAFVNSKSEDPEPKSSDDEKFHHHKIVGTGFLSQALDELLKTLTVKVNVPGLPQDEAAFVDFIQLHHTPRDASPGFLVKLLCADSRGADGADSGVDKGTPGRKQALGKTCVAAAFGQETALEDLDAQRKALIAEILPVLGQSITQETFRALRAAIRPHFEKGLGETRRAANDVTLWDHAYSVASLYKAALAGMLLDGKSREPREVTWRFFRVGFDGLGLIAKGHKIGDILGYRDKLEQAKDAVADIVEFAWAIGNEVYRDENGVYFILPALVDAHKQQACDQALAATIRQRVLEITAGEVVPIIAGESAGSRGLTRLGPQIAQTDRDVRIPYAAGEQPTWPEHWGDGPQLAERLRDSKKDNESNLGQCDVCVYQGECAAFEKGRMPQADGCPVCQAHPKCENQGVCPTCGQRRQSRVQPWLEQKRQSTIWIDEVADRNDRVALIVGRFDLTHWLDGAFEHTYLNSLLSHSMAEWHQKTVSKGMQDAAVGVNYSATLEYLKYVLAPPEGKEEEAVIRLSSFLDFAVGKKNLIGTLESIYERAAQPIEQTPENLATLLFRKHPSSARLRRIWRTTEDFWQVTVARVLQEFTYDRFAEQAQPARHQRVAITAENVSLSPLRPLPSLAYDARIGPLRLSVYWDQKRFITLDNLQLLMEQTGATSANALCDWLNRQQFIHIEEPITGQARKRALEDKPERKYPLRGSALTDDYKPYVSTLATPRTFMALVPGVDAADILREISQKYEAHFGKVRNRLPLHLGVVYFHRRSPLYAAMDAARRMLPVGCRAAETWTLKNDAQSITLRDSRAGVKLEFENGRQWDVDVTTGDPDIPDDYYPYFLVAAENHPMMVLAVPDPTQAGKLLPLVHARDLKQGNRVRITPSLFDFEYLETIGRRFEVSYADGQRRARAGLAGSRPYNLEQLTDLRRLWWLLSGHYVEEFGARKALTPTQLSNLERLIGAQAQEWGQGDWKKLAGDATFRDYAKATLANVGKGWWKSLESEQQEFVLSAVCDGSFMDVIELYRKIMKVKPLGKEVE